MHVPLKYSLETPFFNNFFTTSSYFCALVTQKRTGYNSNNYNDLRDLYSIVIDLMFLLSILGYFKAKNLTAFGAYTPRPPSEILLQYQL